jgi:hypothetical protein
MKERVEHPIAGDFFRQKPESQQACVFGNGTVTAAMIAILLIIGQLANSNAYASDIFRHSTPEVPGQPKTISLTENDSGGHADPSPTSKKSIDWLLTATIGLGYTAIGDESFGLTNLFMSKENFTRINYRPPLSFGVKMRSRPKGKTVFESGLVYSQLVSSFEWSSWGDYSMRQRLHYVGIPVGFTTFPGNNPKSDLRFYFSGGLMVEKGLRSIYRQRVVSQNQTYTRTTTVRSSVDGFQWSLSGAVGLSYRLKNDFDLRLEPRIGYYFKNDQPVSVRTEKPLYFGVHLGLNYKL